MIDTLQPYDVVPYEGIQYGVCREYDHISRYRCLRQVVHNYNESDRFVALETVNPFTYNTEVIYYDVPAYEENRLDIIANKLLGSATYAWVIAYFNHIEDGYTVAQGQRIVVPKSFTSLFSSGELLASINPSTLNLGSE